MAVEAAEAADTPEPEPSAGDRLEWVAERLEAADAVPSSEELGGSADQSLERLDRHLEPSCMEHRKGIDALLLDRSTAGNPEAFGPEPPEPPESLADNWPEAFRP